MNFQILNYYGTTEEDIEIASLLHHVFVQEGYTDTDKSYADEIFAPAKLRKRGEIKLARSYSGKLLGIAIFVQPTSRECQVAKANKGGIHSLAVYPEARGQGIASCLIKACEYRAVSTRYSKMILSTQQTMGVVHRVYQKNGYIENSKRNWSKDGKINLHCL